MGELYAEVCDVLKGVSTSADFTRHIMTRLSIDQELADKVVVEINSNVFSVLKTNLQKQTSPAPETSENLERMGGITIEKPEPESENKMVTPADRGNILAGLENPPSSTAHTSQPPQNLPVGEEEAGPFSETSAAKSTKKEESHTEPLVDLLLSKPAGQSMQNVVATPTAVQKPKITVPTPKSSGGPDPYREPIK